jgi:hypothetical protein
MIEEYRAMGLQTEKYYSRFGTLTDAQFEKRFNDPDKNLTVAAALCTIGKSIPLARIIHETSSEQNAKNRVQAI